MTTATLTLTEFLLARLLEDEERARATGPDWDSDDYEEQNRQSRLSDEQWHSHRCGWRVGEGLSPLCFCGVPERVLAEVDAKRRIVELAGIYADAQYPDYAGGYASGTEDVLALLALPYADHPDYREEWRP